MMSAMGIPQEHIATVMDIDAKTLRKHCGRELDHGSIKATYKVAQNLFRQATKDNNTAAMIFWMKVRAGWSERTEITGANGGAIEISHSFKSGI
jgi:predicted acetyltransferase